MTHADKQKPAPALLKLRKDMRDALLVVLRYVSQATGTEPTQEELAEVLKSYFTLDEVANQINYLRRRPLEEDASANPGGHPQMRINLLTGPVRNTLARAGYFIRPIAEGIVGIRKHVKAMHGIVPIDDELARSLTSSFIVSEIKNQILHARKSGRKKAHQK